jgi:diguanylate cyclase (GGDEF)-like protein/putative nucleotidyltransferase with HDIG domain
MVQIRAKRPMNAGRRPMLLALVYGAFLVLVGITASALVVLTSAHLSSATMNAIVSRDASLVELFVNDNLLTADIRRGGPGEARTADLNAKLRALSAKDQILRLEVLDANGKVLFASEPGLVGSQLGLSGVVHSASAGSPSASLLTDAGTVARLPGPPLGVPSVVQEFLPIVDAGGRTLAVMAVWRDATPLLARVQQEQADVLIVVLSAAVVLAVVLFLVFRAAQARINRQQRQLVEATRRDALTDMLNHGAIVVILAEAVEAMRGTAGEVAIALLDIDNFRLLNDTHGHEAADAVLLRVAELASNWAAAGDHVARYGPDEFLLVRPGAKVTDLEKSVGDLRAKLADLTVQFGESDPLPVTLSAGIAAFPDHAGSVTELLSAATVALQEAKASGGDGVRVAEREAERIVSGSFDVLQGLVIAVDSKDRYTKRHSEDVARYAVFLAGLLGLDDETVATIKVSGLLHDIGKIGIPDVLLRKPSKLTAQEFDVFKQHVALGDAIVRDLPNLETVREGIRHHHEHWNGRGYLEGLEGEEIPLVGRIMAVADAFSAMTTTRPYRKALPIDEALKRLGDAAGTQLQEELVVAFIEGIETAPGAPMPGEVPARLWVPERRVA